MNRTQLIVLWIGVIVLMGLFPPWIISGYMVGAKTLNRRTIAGPYALITSPLPSYPRLVLDWPQPPRGFLQDEPIESVPRISRWEDVCAESIDGYRLSIQWIMVAVVTAGLIYTLKDKRKG